MRVPSARIPTSTGTPLSARAPVALIAGLLALLVPLAAPVGARSAPAGSARQDTPTIRVTSVTPWVEPDGDFRVELRIEGAVPPDAVIRTAVHQRLRASRSDSLRDVVADAVAGEDLPGMMQSPASRPLAELGDPAVGVVVDIPIRSGRSGSSDRLLLPNSGIHPVSVSVTDAAGDELAGTTVFLNRLPEAMPTTADGAPGTLSLSMFAVVDGPAALTPDGQPDLDDASRRSLSEVASLVSTVPQAPLTLAIRPNLLDALARSAEPTDRATLGRLQDALRSPGGVAVARMPYVAADTGGLVDAPDGGAEVLRQIALGNTAIEDALAVEPVGTSWYGDDTVTTPALELLDAFGVRRVVTAADRLRLTDRDLEPRTVMTSAVGLTPSDLTATAPDPSLTDALAADVGVGERTNRIITALMATWFTASTSEDGFPGPSAVLSLPPSTDPAVLSALLGALATPGPITTDPAAVPTSPAVVDGDQVTAQLPTAGADQRAAVRGVVDTRARINGFRSLAPTATAEASEWELLDAQTLDRTMSAAERDRFHTAIDADIRGVTGRIEMPKPRRVVITGENQQIPLRFRNDLPYDVEIELWIRSVRLDIDGGERRRVTLHPGENRIDIAVTSRAPGGTLLRIDASSPDGELALPSVAIPVTSSTISGVGAALSIVSLLFLAGWWFVSIRRDRRRRREGPDDGPTGGADDDADDHGGDGGGPTAAIDPVEGPTTADVAGAETGTGTDAEQPVVERVVRARRARGGTARAGSGR